MISDAQSDASGVLQLATPLSTSSRSSTLLATQIPQIRTLWSLSHHEWARRSDRAVLIASGSRKIRAIFKNSPIAAGAPRNFSPSLHLTRTDFGVTWQIVDSQSQTQTKVFVRKCVVGPKFGLKVRSSQAGELIQNTGDVAFERKKSLNAWPMASAEEQSEYNSKAHLQRNALGKKRW